MNRGGMSTRSKYEKKYSDFLWRLSEQIRNTTNSVITVSQEAVPHVSARLERCDEEFSCIMISDTLASVELDYELKLSFGCPYCSYQVFAAELDVFSWKGNEVRPGLVRLLSRCGLLATTTTGLQTGMGYLVCVYLGDCQEAEKGCTKESGAPNPGRPEAHSIEKLNNLLTNDIQLLISLLSTLTNLSRALDVPIWTMLLAFEGHCNGNSLDATGIEKFAEWANQTYTR